MSPLPPGERAAPLRRQSSPPAPRGQTPPPPPPSVLGCRRGPAALRSSRGPSPGACARRDKGEVREEGRGPSSLLSLPSIRIISISTPWERSLRPYPRPAASPVPGGVSWGGSPALTHPQARRRPARQAAGGSRERGRLCPPHRPQAGPRGGRPRGGMGGG